MTTTIQADMTLHFHLLSLNPCFQNGLFAFLIDDACLEIQIANVKYVLWKIRGSQYLIGNT